MLHSFITSINIILQKYIYNDAATRFPHLLVTLYQKYTPAGITTNVQNKPQVLKLDPDFLAIFLVDYQFQPLETSCFVKLVIVQLHHFPSVVNPF